MEEHILVAMAQKGDRAALERLLQQNYAILKGYMIKMTLKEDLADDLTQDTLLKAMLNIQKYKPTGKFSTWLIAIGKNIYVDKLRKDKRIVPQENPTLNNVDLDSNLEEKVINKIEFEKIKQHLRLLSEEKRSVFILKHYYGYSYKEIAEIEKCPIGTVRSRLHNAINQLQQMLEGRAVK
ncbi:RNA polymerase sigma factor SigY [Serpentinicella sp. ANB-PHB4]|uniref:RNA polymerase sigma factor SigY n=1 Tax=Serpentinicella sp. ANB-PHB4 TaxID=3074076 RepID=UPI002854772A|nr:RNA polymerase sigma factor SigY [Serpentinicella sp. ANB-PHB4]MDR5659276.1 RNA polymerase sigma factor SigY [Serpentinicella sp. ANB-PHB4]